MADANFTTPEMPTPELFGARLNEALRYRKSELNEQEKVDFVARITGRTARTARVWLSGGNRPRRNKDLHSLAEGLSIRYVWLHFGLGYSPFQADLLEKLANMPPEYVPKLMRYLLRLMNKDPKALRWSAMCERGELSGWQVLDMA